MLAGVYFLGLDRDFQSLVYALSLEARYLPYQVLMKNLVPIMGTTKPSAGVSSTDGCQWILASPGREGKGNEAGREGKLWQWHFSSPPTNIFMWTVFQTKCWLYLWEGQLWIQALKPSYWGVRFTLSFDIAIANRHTYICQYDQLWHSFLHHLQSVPCHTCSQNTIMFLIGVPLFAPKTPLRTHCT